MKRTATSACRQQIRKRLDKINAMVPPILSVRGELVHGWVRVNRRKCGHATCRCARGELHETLSFGTRQDGRYLHRGIRPDKIQWLQQATERWSALHRTRAQVAKECQALLRAIDDLEASLCVDWREAVSDRAQHGKES